MYFLQKISNFFEKSLCLIPSKTRICDRLTIASTIYWLVAILNITLNHNTLYKILDLRIVIPAVDYLFDNSWLFNKFLARIIVVGINYTCMIYEVELLVCVSKEPEILRVIIGYRLSMLIQCTSQYTMCQRISVCMCLPSRIEECVVMLSCYTGIHHNVVVTTCRILHTYRNIHSTCGKSVLLILNRTCAYGNVREDIIYILPVF